MTEGPYLVTIQRELYVEHATSTEQAIRIVLDRLGLTLDDLHGAGYTIAAFPEPSEPLDIDRCRYCQVVIGHGAPQFHLGVCDREPCRVRQELELRGLTNAD